MYALTMRFLPVKEVILRIAEAFPQLFVLVMHGMSRSLPLLHQLLVYFRGLFPVFRIGMLFCLLYQFQLQVQVLKYILFLLFLVLAFALMKFIARFLHPVPKLIAALLFRLAY